MFLLTREQRMTLPMAVIRHMEEEHRLREQAERTQRIAAIDARRKAWEESKGIVVDSGSSDWNPMYDNPDVIGMTQAAMIREARRLAKMASTATPQSTASADKASGDDQSRADAAPMPSDAQKTTESKKRDRDETDASSSAPKKSKKAPIDTEAPAAKASSTAIAPISPKSSAQKSTAHATTTSATATRPALVPINNNMNKGKRSTKDTKTAKARPVKGVDREEDALRAEAARDLAEQEAKKAEEAEEKTASEAAAKAAAAKNEKRRNLTLPQKVKILRKTKPLPTIGHTPPHRVEKKTKDGDHVAKVRKLHKDHVLEAAKWKEILGEEFVRVENAKSSIPRVKMPEETTEELTRLEMSLNLCADLCPEGTRFGHPEDPMDLD